MINPHPPLIDLLGAKWQLGAKVAGAAWSSDGRLAGFGLGDGAVVLARAEWDGGPETVTRMSGGVEVRPPRNPSPPVSRVSAHKSACLAFVAGSDPGFLSGGADGRLLQVAPDGAIHERATFPGRRLALVAAAKADWCACASGRSVRLIGPSRQSVTLPDEASALAFRPGGQELAAAYRGGVLVRPNDDRKPAQSLICPDVPKALAWSPDGRFLAASVGEVGLRVWHVEDGSAIPLGEHLGQPLSLSFACDGSFLAASGAARIQCWHLDPARGTAPFTCGLANERAPATVVACHPRRAMIAAGYGTGAVLLCQPGADDVLFVRSGGGGAVTGLAWSPDAARLAIGTEEGEAGIVFLPDLLFRASPPRPSRPAAAPEVTQ